MRLRPWVVLLLLASALPAGAATFTVNRSDDIAPRGTAVTCLVAASSDCTLREAIIKANAALGADVIVFAVGTNGVPITLSIPNGPSGNEDESATGDLDVNGDLTIAGNGPANTIVQAGTSATNGIDKVLAVNPYCTSPIVFAMSGVTIRYGRNAQALGRPDYAYTGGGMDWCGSGTASMTLTDVVFEGNTNVNAYGGGLNIDEVNPANGTVTITNCTFRNNTSAQQGGGINVYGDGVQVTISGSTIQGNQTLDGGAGSVTSGGGIDIRITHTTASGSPLVVLDSTLVTGNVGHGLGGGINVLGNQDVTIRNGSVISNNQVLAQGNYSSAGGGLYFGGSSARTNTITDTVISGNHADQAGAAAPGPAGGGIYVASGTVTLGPGSAVASNTSGEGAGIFLAGSGAALTATGVTLSGNAAAANGGGLEVLAGTASVTGSLFAGNTAGGSGGAIAVTGGTLTATYNRISGNGASTSGRGAYRSVGTATLTNDWWGCSSDPTAGGTPCDDVSGAAATPWLRVLLTPVSSNLVTNQTTTLTASVNTNSAGTDVSANVGVLLGQPVTWGATAGALSGQQAAIQPGGTATAIFTATNVGPATVAAAVDADPSTGTRSNVQAITMDKANTTAATPGQSAVTTFAGEPFTVTFGVTGAFGNAPVAPWGVMIVSDGVDSCSVAMGGCSLALNTPGTRTLTATYSGDPNFNGSTSAGVTHTVIGPATHFAVSAPASAPAGAAFSITVTALDQAGNTATGYGGTVHFTTDNGPAVLPADSTLTNGTGTFSATLYSAVLHTITARDTVTSSIVGTSGPISVTVTATHFAVSAPTLVQTGSAFSFSVTALEASGNTDTAYAGVVHFTSTDGTAVLPADATLTNGAGSFSATLSTTGTQTLTATDAANPSITGTTDPIAVAPPGAAALSGVITAKTGTQLARDWTVTVTNAGPGGAYGARIDSFSLVQTAGSACTPVFFTVFPLDLGDVGPGAAASGKVTIFFGGCPADAQFRADMAFSANAGADAASRTLYHQFF